MRSLTRDASVTQQKLTPGIVRRIFGFIKPYKTPLIIFLVLVVIDGAIGVVNPLLFKDIIDNGILGHEPNIIIPLALIALGISLFDAGLSLVESYLSAKIGQALVFDMRTKVFDHIQKMSLAFFTRTQTGALVSRLNNDVTGAQQAFTDVLSSVIGNVVSVAFVLGVMFYLSWQLTLIAIILVPVFVFPARYFGRKLQAITRESYDLTAKMNNLMVERFNVAGALLAKLFGRPQDDEKAFEDKAGRVRDIGVTQSLYTRFFFIALTIVASVGTVLVFGWGGILAVRGLIDVGTLVALSVYLSRLYGPLTALSNVNVDVMTALVSFDRVFEVLDLPPMVTEKSGAVAIPRGQARVEFDHVNFRYPTPAEVSLASLESVATLARVSEKEVLTDVSFAVEPGTMTALVGHSGAGKTTIAQLAARLYDARSGTVRINGTDVRDATLASLYEIIGVVTQDAHMFHDTIRANLLYAKPDATETQMKAALAAAQILSAVQSLPQGLDTLVGDRGYRFSGGEKQRLAIARLLLKSPDIIVLDEATAHLDSESERAIQEAFSVALRGRTSIVIAHRLSTIRNADQILVIEKGRIAERGKHEELLKKGKLYAELYRTQFAAGDKAASVKASLAGKNKK
ncbi:MAG TPA: ABC transporter ATP-binding protein [Candidatus Paceibacterota bacterium]|nr:ABC transporter ATP-binding protein [Candidatus Paceibacterota bacterium]